MENKPKGKGMEVSPQQEFSPLGSGRSPGSGLTDKTDPPLDDHDLSVFGWGFINIRFCVVSSALTVNGTICLASRSGTPVAGA